MLCAAGVPPLECRGELLGVAAAPAAWREVAAVAARPPCFIQFKSGDLH